MYFLRKIGGEALGGCDYRQTPRKRKRRRKRLRTEFRLRWAESLFRHFGSVYAHSGAVTGR